MRLIEWKSALIYVNNRVEPNVNSCECTSIP